ncbi:MAG: CARDB domain-containing protein [Thermodesulfobacteriota bacterium]|nr:CARDB domain-containing protein [Thermodesulfobacteriota bacterium]
MKNRIRLSCSLIMLSLLIGLSVAVAAQPDLYISEFSLQPSSPTQGQSVSVRIGVYNGGDAMAKNFTLAWYGGEKYKHPGCTWRVHKVAAKGGKILHCNYFYPSWYSKIATKAVADLDKEVAEQNEDNNTKIMGIEVLKP